MLNFACEKFNVNLILTDLTPDGSTNLHQFKEVADKIWDTISLIDEFLAKTTSLSEEGRAIVASWKRRRKSMFMLERILKKGGILIDMEDGQVFQVLGLHSSFEEMFHAFPLPIVVETTLLPFRDVIISDGLMQTYTIQFGPSMKKRYKDFYTTAKSTNAIHVRL
ncbi:MAG: hypothetical protein IJU76_12175 [Desulfovibrionaceae bacterium]|nr:hypothetical protein [Desulfovibrionaceae bacterium]